MVRLGQFRDIVLRRSRQGSAVAAVDGTRTGCRGAVAGIRTAQAVPAVSFARLCWIKQYDHIVLSRACVYDVSVPVESMS